MLGLQERVQEASSIEEDSGGKNIGCDTDDEMLSLVARATTNTIDDDSSSEYNSNNDKLDDNDSELDSNFVGPPTDWQKTGNPTIPTLSPILYTTDYDGDSEPDNPPSPLDNIAENNVTNQQ